MIKRQIPEWGESAGKMAIDQLDALNKHLSTTAFVAGETFSIADITLLCGIDFARVVKIRPNDEQKHLLRWYEAVSERPSAAP